MCWCLHYYTTLLYLHLNLPLLLNNGNCSFDGWQHHVLVPLRTFHPVLVFFSRPTRRAAAGLSRLESMRDKIEDPCQECRGMSARLSAQLIMGLVLMDCQPSRAPSKM